MEEQTGILVSKGMCEGVTETFIKTDFPCLALGLSKESADKPLKLIK